MKNKENSDTILLYSNEYKRQERVNPRTENARHFLFFLKKKGVKPVKTRTVSLVLTLVMAMVMTALYRRAAETNRKVRTQKKQGKKRRFRSRQQMGKKRVPSLWS